MSTQLQTLAPQAVRSAARQRASDLKPKLPRGMIQAGAFAAGHEMGSAHPPSPCPPGAPDEALPPAPSPQEEDALVAEAKRRQQDETKALIARYLSQREIDKANKRAADEAEEQKIQDYWAMVGGSDRAAAGGRSGFVPVGSHAAAVTLVPACCRVPRAGARP